MISVATQGSRLDRLGSLRAWPRAIS